MLLIENFSLTVCDICGKNNAEIVCHKDICGSKQLCLHCDEKWHRHPKRKNHTRDRIHPQKEIHAQSTTATPQPVRQPTPPGVSTQARITHPGLIGTPVQIGNVGHCATNEHLNVTQNQRHSVNYDRNIGGLSAQMGSMAVGGGDYRLDFLFKLFHLNTRTGSLLV